jgi:hypothetical protein
MGCDRPVVFGLREDILGPMSYLCRILSPPVFAVVNDVSGGSTNIKPIPRTKRGGAI